MKKKEWIVYFETVNNRKPTAEEISQALGNKEFKASLFDKILALSLIHISEPTRP